MLMRRLGLRLSVKMALNKTMNYLQISNFRGAGSVISLRISGPR